VLDKTDDFSTCSYSEFSGFEGSELNGLVWMGIDLTILTSLLEMGPAN